MKKTTTESELRAWRLSGKSVKEIAQALGRSVNSIYATFAVLGLGVPRTRAPSHVVSERNARALAALERGIGLRQFAAIEGASVQTIRKALIAAGMPNTPAKAMLAKLARIQKAPIAPSAQDARVEQLAAA